MCTAFLTQIRDRSQHRLDRIYKVPNPLMSLEEFNIFYHQDLKALTKSELFLEKNRLRLRLIQTRRSNMVRPSSAKWLGERLAKVEGALKRV